MKDGLYFRGIPTGTDVRKLEDQFGVPAEGTVIHRNDIAKACELDPQSNRYASVLHAWRSKLLTRDNVLLIAGEETGTLVAADPEKRIAWSASQVKRGRRAIGKAIAVSYATDERRLSADSAKSRTAIVGLNEGKLRLAANVMR